MKVFTYFQSISGLGTGSDATLDLWRKSWEVNGWEPVVLNEDSARAHPRYHEFVRAIKSFPSLNHAGFDYHAFLRHLAVATVGTGVIVSTEPDVINYTLRPNHLWEMAGPQAVECHSPVPAFLRGRKEDFETLCRAIAAHRMNEKDVENGVPHMSDQNFFAYYGDPMGIVKFFRTSHLCRDYTLEGWEAAPVVHYGTPYMNKAGFLPKDKFIPGLRKFPDGTHVPASLLKKD